VDDNTRWLRVVVATQQVLLFRGNVQVWNAPVSTSRFGLGEEEGSHRTPRGWHHIAEKIGEGEPLGRVFRGRLPQEVWEPGVVVEEDLVLTRILWLSGDEPANHNSKARYIYFHGTNHEEKIGSPASMGCIRLRNADMKYLFDAVSVGDRVEIVES
jgi:hypothetical protein